METKLLKIKGTEEFAIIDAEDYERVKSFDWRVVSAGTGGNRPYVGYYTGEKGKQRYIRLAHMILCYADSDKKVRVKYINQNTFDLKKSNLTNKLTCNSEDKNIFYLRKSKTLLHRQWILNIYLRHLQKTFQIGRYDNEETGNEIIKFIKANFSPILTAEDVVACRERVNQFSFEKGYFHPSPRSQCYNIGAERITTGGYVEIKMENGWTLKHHVIWEAAGNTIPENHCLFFKDGDKQNFDLENLEAIPFGELGRKINLYKYPEELRPTIELLWELKREIKEHKLSQPKIKKIHHKNLSGSTSVKLYYSPHKYCSWRVVIYYPPLQQNLYIGRYSVREIAQEIVDFIEASNFSIKSREDIENIKSLVRNFAVEKGYRKRLCKSSSKRTSSTIPDFSFNSNQTREEIL